MVKENKYCHLCKQGLNIGIFFKEKNHYFEEGMYCEECAKMIVKKRREEFNG